VNVIINRKGVRALYVDDALICTWDATESAERVANQVKARGLAGVRTVVLRGEGFLPCLSEQEKYRINKKLGE
jgi:hypothetical protein